MSWTSHAQAPVTAPAANPAAPASTAGTQAGANSPAPVLTGLAAMDVIALKAVGPATPLRFGNVIPGSEHVNLNGRNLTVGEDYAIDDAAGVIYLFLPQKAGDSLTVDYRYDNKAAPATSAGSSFTPTTLFSFGQSLNMSLGMGLAERSADGSVFTTNQVGWGNNFSMGSGKMSGLFMIGQRDKQTNAAGLNMDTSAKPGDASKIAGTSQFIVQQFRTSLLGGNAQVDYQDISRNFTGFSQLRGNGYSDAQVKSLTGESGLQRMGFGLDGVKMGAASFTGSFKNVKDGDNALTWETLGLTQGGMKLSYTSRDLSHSFTRYDDLSDADKAILKTESGLHREDFAGSFNQKFAQMSFDSKSIHDDATGRTISRNDFQFGQGLTKLDFGTQDVDSAFPRIGSLAADEKTMYGREAGLHRQWLALDTSVMGKANTLSFHDTEIGGMGGQFHSETLAYASKTWSFQHVDIGAATNMHSIGALQDAEQDADIKLIAGMYDPAAKTGPADRAQFQLGSGIDRSYTSIAAQPFKAWGFSLSDLHITGNTGAIDAQQGAVTGKTLQLTYKHTDYAAAFAQETSLLAVEQQKLGALAGLDRTDFGLNWTMSATRKFTASRLTADDPNGEANRTTAEYVDKKIDITFAGRDVTSGFETTGNIADSEAGLLAALRGLSEQDAHVKWQPASNLKLDSQYSDSRNLMTGTHGEFDNSLVDWNVNKNTEIVYARQDGHNTDPLNTSLDSFMQKFQFMENLGKYGKLQVMEQAADYGIPGSTGLDYDTKFLSYQTNLNKTTTFTTQQTFTAYGNGGSESVDSNTLSETLSKRAGVSVTNTEITAHSETQQDETKQNYGFWYDIGSGLRISYGFASDANSSAGVASTSATTLAVGQNADTTTGAQLGAMKPGQVGNYQVGGGYAATEWDNTTGPNRVQSFSNVGLATVKPMNLGLLKNVTLKVAMDTAADNSAWVRENRLVSAAGKVGPDTIGFDYHSQIDPTGNQAIDRGFHWVSDQNPKDWLRASISYKERSMPLSQTYAIRDYNITAVPTKRIQITNQIQTNPEVVRNDLILGSLPQASRSNKWQVDYLTDATTTLGASWQEMRNDSNGAISRTSGVNAKLFANSPSPVTFFYGLQQTDAWAGPRHTQQRYSMQFDQRAGPHQAFNLFLGNVAYDNVLNQGQMRDNWTVRLNYQLSF